MARRWRGAALTGVLFVVVGGAAASPVHASSARDDGRPGKNLWRTGFENGFAHLQATPWDHAPLAPRVSTLARAGSASAAFSVPPGGSRCEGVPNAAKFTEGDRRAFRFSTMMGNDVRLFTDWQVFVQWKNDGIGSPPLAMVIEDGEFKIGGGWGWPGNTNHPVEPKLAYRSLGSAVTGRWIDWRVRIRFSADPDRGSVSVWRDGRRVVRRWHPPGGTLYPQLRSYLKIGYYRSSTVPGTGTVYHDNWAIRSPRR